MTANQLPPPDVTKTIGAKHGDGSATFASISAFPVIVAGTGSVETFTVVGAPVASEERQLTTPLNVGEGFTPVDTRTSPSTSMSRRPSARSRPCADSSFHGTPPPFTPRIGFVAPVVDSYELGTGYGHIALAVDDLDDTLSQLKDQGIEPEREPYRVRDGGSRLCFVRDPDDYRIELIDRSGK